MWFFLGLAILADLMSWHVQSLVFLGCAVFLYGINRIAATIERGKL